MILDDSLINEFRNKINENDFILHIYQNYESRDKWSCICSAMDWITVAVDFINSDWNRFDNINIKCMNLYTYISSIDILWESVQQLHRVLFNTTKIPFKDENICFETKIIKEDDNDYFKTIRACFGAHPVNISLEEDKNSKRFASWLVGGKDFCSKKDFEVRLYSNQQDKEEIYLGVNISELNRFALRRYEYLLELMKEIDKKYKQFIEDLRKSRISRYDDDILKQLNELKIESHKRLYGNILILLKRLNMYL